MRDVIKTGIILTLICLVITAALAVTDYFTRDVIVRRAAADAEAVRKSVIAADRYEPVDISAIVATAAPSAAATAASRFDGIVDAYRAIDTDGKLAGWIVTAKARGYSADVVTVAGIGADGKIVATQISQIAETPGLGMKAQDAAFLSQLAGFVPRGILKTVKVPKTAPEQIEAISGATITTNAVVKAVNQAIDLAAELNKAEKAGGSTP